MRFRIIEEDGSYYIEIKHAFIFWRPMLWSHLGLTESERVVTCKSVDVCKDYIREYLKRRDDMVSKYNNLSTRKIVCEFDEHSLEIEK